MLKRFLAIACLFVLLTSASNAAVRGGECSAWQFNDLYVFGDSLSDSGNLFAISHDTEPPSPPYFEGRYSNGPVWVESLARLLDMDVDFDTNVISDPLANNQAIGGAFTGFDSELGGVFGVRSQVESFIEAGGSFDREDLVVVWAGANDYLSTDRAPVTVVGDLIKAIEQLATTAGAKHFLVANLPNLGDTPGGVLSGYPEGLNYLTTIHNTLLKKAITKLRMKRRLDILLLDINATFAQILEKPEVFGFDNVTTPCLTQDPDGTRTATGACPADDGMALDAAGVLFWDLIHPTAAAHRQLAIIAHTTLVSARNQRWVLVPRCLNYLAP